MCRSSERDILLDIRPKNVTGSLLQLKTRAISRGSSGNLFRRVIVKNEQSFIATFLFLHRLSPNMKCVGRFFPAMRTRAISGTYYRLKMLFILHQAWGDYSIRLISLVKLILNLFKLIKLTY